MKHTEDFDGYTKAILKKTGTQTTYQQIWQLVTVIQEC